MTYRIGVRYYVHMNSNTTLPISEIRKRIFRITREVQRPDTYYTITEKGRPKAVIMSVEEFESWAETLEVMKDFPDIKKDIAGLEKDIKAGRYRSYISLKEILKDEGYVSSKTKTQRRARSSKAK